VFFAAAFFEELGKGVGVRLGGVEGALGVDAASDVGAGGGVTEMVGGGVGFDVHPASASARDAPASARHVASL